MRVVSLRATATMALRGMALVDAPVKGAQFRVFANRGPGALNQLVAQAAVARASNATAIDLISGGMLARHQPQKGGNLADVGDFAPISQSGNQVGRDNPANPRKTGEPANHLPQFRIIYAEAADLLLNCGGRQKMELQRSDQMV